MKTILLTMFSPFAARNILREDFLAVLLSQPDTRLVLVAPQSKKSFYQEQIKGCPQIVVEGVEPWRHPATWLDGVFFSLSLHYLETETVKILRRSWGKDRGLRFYLVSWPLFKLFKYFPMLRRLCRWLDARLVVDRRPQVYLDRHKPDLVIATHAIYFQEQAFIREAKRRGIQTLSVVNSWDNLSVYKGVVRVLPDVLVVPNEIVRQEAIAWCDMRPDRVAVIGMWNCDHYFRHQPSPRAEFCHRLGLDPTRPFILFASVGRNHTDTEWQDVQMIKDAVATGEISSKLQIVIREHPDPSSPLERGKLDTTTDIVFQAASTPIAGSYEITSDDDQIAYDTIYHSAIVVTVQSTISIEAAVLDKPVININFDGWEERSLYHPRGVKRYHQFTHYLAVYRSGGVRLVNNRAELIEWLNLYLNNPAQDRERRRELAQRFCWRLDGSAVGRLAKIILERV